MKRIITFACSAMIACATAASAQTNVTPKNGSIEFVAHATPSGGVDEPARGIPFYLLSESYADITKEADAEFPEPDMNAFIDSLDVSKELKDWMKKNKWIDFSGEDFIHKLKVDDVMNVPEFYSAYLERNSGDQGSGFPSPKIKESDKTKDPAKYQKEEDQYKQAIRGFMTMVPESMRTGST